jgi:arylsulfatase A-like enzyme
MVLKEDPTIAELLKAQGYASGQFGKNHLGGCNVYTDIPKFEGAHFNPHVMQAA